MSELENTELVTASVYDWGSVHRARGPTIEPHSQREVTAVMCALARWPRMAPSRASAPLSPRRTRRSERCPRSTHRRPRLTHRRPTPAETAPAPVLTRGHHAGHSARLTHAGAAARSSKGGSVLSQRTKTWVRGGMIDLSPWREASARGWWGARGSASGGRGGGHDGRGTRW